MKKMFKRYYHKILRLLRIEEPIWITVDDGYVPEDKPMTINDDY